MNRQNYIAANTEIFDYNSGLPLKIESIVENKIKCKVLSLKSKNESFGKSYSEFDFSFVNNWIKYKNKKRVIKITTSYGVPLTLALEHMVLTNRGWKKVKSLKEGDYVIKINCCRLALGDNKFDKDYARFLGYWLGDGYSDSGKTPTVANIDKLIIRDLERIANNKNYKLTYVKPLSYNFSDELPPRRSWDGTIIATNKFNLLLNDLGLLGKHEDKKIIPLKTFSLRKKYIAEVLSGLFMTDGTVNKTKPTVEFCNISEIMVKQIHYLLLISGIHSRVWKQEKPTNGKHPLWILSINGINRLKEFMKLVPLISEKRKRLKHWCEQPTRKDNKGKRKSFSKNLSCEKIVKIENCDKQKVYSLTTDNYHNYLANGYVCYIS